jgi:opacity protein-like surface antigen
LISLSNRTGALAEAGVLAAGAPAWAQTYPPLPAVALPPANVLLPNNGGVPIGEIAGLEVGAFLARANDSSSAFYNPAGLTRAERTSVSGTAGTYQWNAVAIDGLASPAGSFQQVPAMFGVALRDFIERPALSAGLSVARTMAWHQVVDFERTVSAGAAVDRLSYSSEAVLDAWLASAGVGYNLEGKWRVGSSIDLQWTTMDRRQTVADQLRTSGGFAALSVTSRSDATATHMRFGFGTQYDLTPNVILGAVYRTRGFGLYSHGFSMLEGVSASDAGTSTASYFEDAPDTAYRVPSEFKAGAALVASRVEVEVDLLVYRGAGEYLAFTGARPVTVITAPGAGRPPLVSEHPARASVIDSRTVVDVAAGGHLELTSSGSWIVHGGYGTSRSPVGPHDTVFTKMHLQKVTAGVSGRTSRFLGSFGIQYLWGDSGPVTLRELPSGTLTTRFGVSHFGFVYSLAVLF